MLRLVARFNLELTREVDDFKVGDIIFPLKDLYYIQLGERVGKYKYKPHKVIDVTGTGVYTLRELETEYTAHECGFEVVAIGDNAMEEVRLYRKGEMDKFRADRNKVMFND